MGATIRHATHGHATSNHGSDAPRPRGHAANEWHISGCVDAADARHELSSRHRLWSLLPTAPPYCYTWSSWNADCRVNAAARPDAADATNATDATNEPSAGVGCTSIAAQSNCLRKHAEVAVVHMATDHDHGARFCYHFKQTF